MPLCIIDSMDMSAVVRRNVTRHLQECQIGPVKLAARTGLSRQTIHMLTRGDSDPAIRSAWRLADALGITIDALVGRVNGQDASKAP